MRPGSYDSQLTDYIPVFQLPDQILEKLRIITSNVEKNKKYPPTQLHTEAIARAGI